jgi:hypothetical protein
MPPGVIDVSNPTASPAGACFIPQYPPDHEEPEGSQPFPPNLEVEFNKYIVMTPSPNMLDSITRSLMQY